MTARLSEIFGQDRAVGLLRRAWGAGRLAHGLLFAGPVGVGKGTTARALGALVLCEKPIGGGVAGAEACGKCESCRVFAAGNHPDWHVVTKELIRYHDKSGTSKGIDLSIKVIRPELIEPAGMKAVMGLGKVFVVEQAELMNAAAQNALLKTLEEPAGRTVIVLLTDQPGALLATVRSRCQLVAFGPLSREVVVRELVSRGVAAELAGAAAELGEGSLGEALRFAREGIVEKARELFPLVDGGKAVHEWLKSAADAIAAGELEKDELASKDQAMRQGLALYLRLASHHLRGKLRKSSAGEAEGVCRGIDALVRAEQFIDANVNVGLALQQLTIELREGAVGGYAHPTGGERLR